MIRSILFNIFFWSFVVVYIILMYPFVFFFNQKQTCNLVLKPILNVMLFFLKIFTRVGCEIRGKENLNEVLDKGPVIIGCNHQSIWETLVMYKFFDEGLTTVVKEELLKIPVARLYFKRLGCIPINRKEGIKSIKRMIKISGKSLERGTSILIFPSGTREKGGNYKFAGIYAIYSSIGNVPVIPVVVNSGSHWPRRSFKKIPGVITLQFKEAIEPNLSKNEFIDKLGKRLSY